MGEGEGEFEVLVGITEFTNKAPGFRGILKQRYSDFIVREIDMENACSSLTSTNANELERKYFITTPDASAGETAESKDEDEIITNVLEQIGRVSGGVFGAGTLLPGAASAAAGNAEECKKNLGAFLKQCLVKSDECPTYFTACPCADKESRTKVHQIIRKYLPNVVDSEALEVKGAKFIRLVAKHKLKNGNKTSDGRNRSPAWPQGLGDYLQFTMLKENVDTMSAVSVISRTLRMKVDSFKYAGTKDKRAVTSQKCTVYRRRPADLARMNKFNVPPVIRVGDFQYVQQPLKLGSLRGNNFAIVLRNIDASPETIAQACDAMRESGFINYFGLQRFGRGGSKSHEVGRALLKSEWKLAVHLLFTPREGDKDDIANAKRLFAAKEYKAAFKAMPQSLHSECCVLEALKTKPEDYLGAFNRIPKNPRLICIHAYQSYIWNMAASERIRRFGLVCVVGDLVLASEAGGEGAAVDLLLGAGEDLMGDDCDEGGGADAVADPAVAKAEDAIDHSHQSSKSKVNVRALTPEDIYGGAYTIRDVLLPLPGFDSQLPANEIGDFYTQALARDGIALSLFTSCFAQYRSSGAYRRIIQMPDDFQWSCFSYKDPNAELMPTELTYLRQGASATTEVPTTFSTDAMPTADSIFCGQLKDAQGGSDGAESTRGPLTGVLLKFTLPPGTYATMMLREVTKQGTDSQFQAGLTAQAATEAAAKVQSAGASASVDVGVGAEPVALSTMSPDELKVAGELLAMGSGEEAESAHLQKKQKTKK